MCKKIISPALLLTLIAGIAILVGSPVPVQQMGGGCGVTEISGTVYIDFDLNSTKETLEPGVENVTVTAYDNFNNAVATTITGVDGAYSLNLSAGQYRVEFSDFGYYLYPGPEGSANKTTVVFVSAGNCNVDLGLSSPAEYCDPTPNVATPKYIAGNPLLPGASADADSLVSFRYDYGSTSCDNAGVDCSGRVFGSANHILPSSVSKNQNIGTVWGVAYQRSRKKLYSSAVLKRHAGLGPDGTGAIYVTDYSDPNTPVTSLYIDLKTNLGIDTGNDPRAPGDLPTDPTVMNKDEKVFSLIGRIGVGDLDISADEQYLWFVNLKDRKLYSLFIGDELRPRDISDISSYVIPDRGCSNGDFRPWGLKIHKADIYVGVVCSAETSQNDSEVSAYIERFNGSSFSSYVNFQLPDPKGFAMDPIYNPRPDSGTKFHAWPNNLEDVSSAPESNFYFVSYPVAVLSAIEFLDDGRMVAGIMDLSGMLFGRLEWSPNYIPPSPPNPLRRISGISGGDILIFCPDSNGTQILESNGSCGGAPPSAGAGNSEGPGGGEYFFDDYVNFNGDPLHKEVSLGSLAYLPHSAEIMSLSYDSSGNLFTAGPRYYAISGSNPGSYQRSYDIYDTDFDAATFGKTVGLGDVELLCNPAPLEVGNRVFRDSNDNGVQDADEPGIGGVTVHLYDQNNTVSPLSTQITSASGEYYFREFDGISPLTAYTIRLDAPSDYSTGGPLSGLSLTGADRSDDINDSDGVLVAGFPELSFSTGIGGANNHTYDFGFKASCVASVEICDELDNDCDGAIDEDGCETPTPTPSPSPTPTATPSASPSPSPSITPTTTPSSSPTPSATPTPDESPPPDCDKLDLSGEIAKIDGVGKTLLAYGKALANRAKKSGAPEKKITKLINTFEVIELTNWRISNTKLTRSADICAEGVICIEIDNSSVLDELRNYVNQMFGLVKKLARLVTLESQKGRRDAIVRASEKAKDESMAAINRFPVKVKDCTE